MNILSRGIFAKTLIPIGLTCLLGAILLIFVVPQLLKDSAITNAADSARATVSQFKTLRKYYVNNIVKKVKGTGVKLSFDHQGVDSTIPLPATVIHDMSQLLADSGTAIKLYSLYPFPNRAERKLDDYSRKAWTYFQQNPDGVYQSTVERDGKTFSRVALSDKMVAGACVNCHNSHPLTPKKGWKLGDVRGVLEVETQIDNQIANGIAMSQKIGLILASMVIMIFLAVFFSLKTWVVKPLAMAGSVANSIENGNLDNKIEIKAHDEVSGMLESLARMQHQLKLSADQDHRVMAENARITQALNSVSANVMVADADHNIIYLNNAVTEMFSEAESDIRKELPNFETGNLLGANIDQFHKNPLHQTELLAGLEDALRAELKIGGRTMAFTANPVIDENSKRLGTVVEWLDRTAEIAVQNDIEELVSSAQNGDLKQRISLQDKRGFFLDLSTGMNNLVDTVGQVFDEIAQVMGALSQGDLKLKMTGKHSGTYAEVQENVNLTIDRLNEIVGNILDSTESITNGSNEISSGNNSLSSRTEQQAASLQETASSMEELTATVRQNADNAQKANQQAGSARETAREGGAIVNNAVTAMSEINTASNQIADIVGVIDEIAFQTNLLALNASVEAARAGEQGRGFAVVATEVRNLAQRSATSAKEIKELIQDSVDKVDAGSELVNQSGEALENIVGAIQKVGDIVSEIAMASKEQATGIDQINATVTDLDDLTQQNAALAEETSAASVSMNDRAQEMNRQVRFFQIAK